MCCSFSQIWYTTESIAALTEVYELAQTVYDASYSTVVAASDAYEEQINKVQAAIDRKALPRQKYHKQYPKRPKALFLPKLQSSQSPKKPPSLPKTQRYPKSPNRQKALRLQKQRKQPQP